MIRGLEQIPWIYDAALAVLEKTGLGRWRVWLARYARGRILDLGCGTGRNLSLFPTGGFVVGLDPCAEALVRARRRSRSAALVLGRAEELPFREGSFDTVVSGLVLCSVDDPRRALLEVRRVLAREGRLRALEHVRASGRLRAWLQDRAQPVWTRLTGGCRPNRDTERTVLDCGFRIEPDGRRASGNMRRFSAVPSPPGVQ